MQTSHNFDPIFTPIQKLSLSKIPTSSNITQSHLGLSPNFINLLSQNTITIPKLVVCLGSSNPSNQAEQWYESMLLQIYGEEPKPKPSQPVFYNKIQYSLPRSTQQAIYWIYGYIPSLQMAEQQKIHALNLLMVFSSVFVLQKTDIEYYRQFLIKILKIQKRIYGKTTSNVFIMTNNNDRINPDPILLDHDLELYAQALPIMRQTSILEVDTESLQAAINKGRCIIQNMLNHSSISPDIIIDLVNLSLNGQISIEDSGFLQKKVDQIIKKKQQQKINQIVNGYQNKFYSSLGLKNPENPIVLQEMFDEHLLLLQEIMLMAKGKQTKIVAICSQQCNQKFKQLALTKYLSNIEYCKSFLKKETEGIGERVTNKSIKKIGGLSQECENLTSNYFKKIQPLISLNIQYETNLEVFSEIIQQMFSSLSQFTKSIHEILYKCIITNCNKLDEIKEEKAQRDIDSMRETHQKQLQQLKQINKSLNKELTECIVQKQNLQSSYQFLQNREQILEQTIAKLHIELQNNSNKQDALFAKSQQQYFEEINKLKEEFQQRSEQADNFKRELILLNSQIEKQKMLHQQTQHYYESLIEQHKIAQLTLKDQVHRLSQQNLESQESLATYRRQIEQNTSIMMSRSFTNVSPHEKQIEELKIQLHKVEKKYEELQFRNNFEREQLTQKMHELQLANRILENTSVEQQAKAIKSSGLSNQLEKLEAAQNQSLIMRKNQQKQIALLTQEKVFLSENLAALKQRYGQISEDKQKIQAEFQQLNEEQQKRVKQTAEEWTQTDEDILEEEKLIEALKIVEVLEQEYHKVRSQLEEYQNKERYQMINSRRYG